MSKEINVTLKPFTVNGSGKTFEVQPEGWANPTAYAQYCIEYANSVIMQRASAGKSDEPEKAEKAVEGRMAQIIAGTVPSGGGFTRLTPEDYAMKETLTASKVKMEKGESIAECLTRLATKLTEIPEGMDGAEIALMVADTRGELQAELEATEVYKLALKARKAKAKASKAGGLIGQL